MRELKTALFGPLPMPETFDEVHAVLLHPPDLGQPNVYIWRGQGNVAWPIHSSAYRCLVKGRAGVGEEQMQVHEKWLLEFATHKGFRFLDGRELSDLELLARLQHHGAATRFVDATRNALVGLYFCCASEPRRIGLLLGLNVLHLGGSDDVGDKGPYEEVMENLPSTRAQTWEPPVVSPRIASQRSQFLYSPVVDTTVGSLAMLVREDTILAMAIGASMKKKCLKSLAEIYDIRYETLFPDIDGFGYAHSYRFSREDWYRW